MDPGFLILERILMFIIGAVFLGGGLIFIKQAVEGAKNMIESALFGLLGFMAGVWLIWWAIAGIPE